MQSVRRISNDQIGLLANNATAGDRVVSVACVEAVALQIEQVQTIKLAQGVRDDGD